MEHIAIIEKIIIFLSKWVILQVNQPGKSSIWCKGLGGEKKTKPTNRWQPNQVANLWLGFFSPLLFDSRIEGSTSANLEVLSTMTSWSGFVGESTLDQRVQEMWAILRQPLHDGNAGKLPNNNKKSKHPTRFSLCQHSLLLTVVFQPSPHPRNPAKKRLGWSPRPSKLLSIRFQQMLSDCFLLSTPTKSPKVCYEATNAEPLLSRIGCQLCVM